MKRIVYAHSQPPLLSEMVRAVHAVDPDKAFLTDALRVLRKEHAYWAAPPKLVFVKGVDGAMHALTRYHAAWKLPRPEAYTYAVSHHCMLGAVVMC